MHARKTSVLRGRAENYESYLRQTCEFVGMHKVLDIPQVAIDTLADERERRVENGEPLV